jgi:hypothetical protein
VRGYSCRVMEWQRALYFCTVLCCLIGTSLVCVCVCVCACVRVCVCGCAGIQAAVLAGLAFNGSIQSNFPVREYTTKNLIDNFVFHTFLEIGMILTFLSMVCCLPACPRACLFVWDISRDAELS